MLNFYLMSGVRFQEKKMAIPSFTYLCVSLFIYRVVLVD